MGLMVTDEYPETVTAAQVIAAELEPIGITVEIETLRLRHLAGPARTRATSTPSCSAGWATSTRPSSTSSSTTPTGRATTRATATRRSTSCSTQAATEVDEDARKELYDQAAKIIVDDVSYLYLYNPDVVQAWTPGLVGLRMRGGMSSRATMPSNPHSSRRIEVEQLAGGVAGQPVDVAVGRHHARQPGQADRGLERDQLLVAQLARPGVQPGPGSARPRPARGPPGACRSRRTPVAMSSPCMPSTNATPSAVARYGSSP